MKYELKSFGLKTTAKVYAALIGVVYIIVGGVFFLVNIVVSLAHDGFTWLGFASALVSLVLFIILSALFGALSGLVMAWLYNKIVEKIGGVEIEIADVAVDEDKDEDKNDRK